ncbi:MAG: hypothetical protein U0804_10450 [Gemmataceae bacterium]
MAGAIIFVPALAASAVMGFVFALFAANHYLTVMQSTAAGARHVTWGDEGVFDGFWKPFYLLWLAGLWAGPAMFVARAGGGGWLTTAAPLLVVWLCYPVSQLSSLSATSVWLPLHPGVFDRLAQKPRVVLGFLALSLVPIAGVGFAANAVLGLDGLPSLLFGCGLLVMSLYLYARLLGRLAFVLRYTKSRLAPKKKPEPRDELPPVQPPPPEEEAEGFRQPSELPPITTPDDGPLSGYNVAFADEPKPAKPRVRAEAAHPRERDPDDDGTYGVNEPDGAALPEERLPASVVKPRDDEMKLLDRSDVPRKPKVAWSAEVLAFLGQPETWAAAGLLTCFAVVFGGLVRVCRDFNPARLG